MNGYLLSKGISALLLAVAFPLFCISCTNRAQVVAQLDGMSDDGLDEKRIDREMDAYIDISQSPYKEALITAIYNFLNALPEIVETWNVTKLRLYQFGEYGWAAEERLKIDLPKLMLPRPPEIDAGELGKLRNIRQAIESHRAAQVAREEVKTRREYREEVKKTLSRIEGSMLLPPPNSPEPPCTDLNGVLRRVSKISDTRPRLVIVITDGGENCTSSIQQVPGPESALALVIILVPEMPEKAGRTRNKNRKQDHEQFADRSAQLSAAIPWAMVIPYFREDLSRVFTEAEKVHTSYTKATN